MKQFVLATLGFAFVMEGVLPATFPAMWRKVVRRIIDAEADTRQVLGWATLLISLFMFWLGYLLLQGADGENGRLWPAITVGIGISSLFEGMVIRLFGLDRLGGLAGRLGLGSLAGIRAAGIFALACGWAMVGLGLS